MKWCNIFLIYTMISSLITGCGADLLMPYKINYEQSINENDFLHVKNFPGYNENLEVYLKNDDYLYRLSDVMNSICKDFYWFDGGIYNVMIYMPEKKDYPSDSQLVAIYSHKKNRIDFFGSKQHQNTQKDISMPKKWCQKNN